MSASAWPRVELDTLASQIDYGVTASAVQDPIGPKFLRITDIQDDRVEWDSVPYCVCEPREENFSRLAVGDIVFARTGATTGKSYLITSCPDRTVFASYLIRVRPDTSKLDPRYLARFFQTPDYWRQITSSSSGTAQPGVNSTRLRALTLPLPPLPEQRRIADILDKADAIRRKRKEAITLTEDLLRSAFLEMFGDPVTNPKGWPEVSIGEAAERVTKGESPGWQGFEYQEHGVRFVTSENVLFGQLNLGKAKFIPSAFDEKIARSRLQENDVLVNLVGASIGRAAMVSREALPANVNQAVAVISLNPNVLAPSFVLHQLLTNTMQRRLLGNIVDAARANISLTNIRDLKVIRPPLAEQLRWQNAMVQFERLLARYNAAIDASGHLFSSLVDRAFRGELTAPSASKKKQLDMFDTLGGE